MQAVTICLWAIGGVALLVFVRTSAQQLLQTDSQRGPVQASATPLLTLTNLEIRVRSSGAQSLDINANRLILTRDLSNVTIDGVTQGIVTAQSLPNFNFSAGHLDLHLSAWPSIPPLLNLSHGVSAHIDVFGTPVSISAPGLTWQAPSGVATFDGPVTANVANLGTVKCLGMAANPSSGAIEFSGISATMTSLPGARTLLVDDSAPQTADQSASGDTGADDSVHVQAPGGGRWDEQQRTLTIRGPVTFTQQDASVQTVGAVYDRATNTAQAGSTVHLKDSQSTLVGDHGTIDFSSHVATLDGNVVLISTPKADADKQTSASSDQTLDAQTNKPTTMDCDHMTYNYRTKLADASGNLVIKQTNRTVTADSGHYDANTQVALLSGNIDAKSDDGRDLRTATATISMKKGNEFIDLPGPISGVFSLPSEDNPRPSGSRGKDKKGAVATIHAPAASVAPAPAPSAAPPGTNAPTETPAAQTASPAASP
jgi:lipopolysaccharide export system protein LptA